ncbi:MAG: methyltransferase domain-containing protein [Endomicrobia bacterium]|nr:methyltransferase domain-containing protein [Endomicrobiia bacterium]
MKEFWNFKANKYPRPFDLDVLSETKKIVSKIEEAGVILNDKDIIDIGCGTGIYGLVFAEKAKRVICLDFSDEMIKVLREEVVKRNIKNVNWILSDFSELDLNKFYKSLDIAFASMTPAIKTEEDILRMELISREWCIYIGWAGKRENKVFDEVYQLLGLKPYIPQGFYNIKEILKKNKKDYKSFIFETSWNWSGSIEDAVLEVLYRTKMDKVSFSKDIVIDYFKSKFPDGVVKTMTTALEGILIWNV